MSTKLYAMMGRRKFSEGLARHSVNNKMSTFAGIALGGLEKDDGASSDADDTTDDGELKPMVDKSAKDIARLHNT
jgi:hypothetical protein